MSDRKSDISSSPQGPMIYPKMKKKNFGRRRAMEKKMSLPSVLKVEKNQKIKLVHIKSSKMASYTSFSQIKEVRPVMKTAQPDLLSEEEIEVEIILYLLHRYILIT